MELDLCISDDVSYRIQSIHSVNKTTTCHSGTKPRVLNLTLKRILNFLSIFYLLEEENMNLIWTGVVVLFVLWLLGFSINIGGGLIHLLLVLALIGVAYNLLTGRSV
jgi:hypothetical protein